MRKILFLAAALCLFSMAAFAQKSSYAGTWTLDMAKSTMDERMRARIESITMTVAQTETELKVSTATRQAPPPADAPVRQAAPGRGDATTTYDLSGRETTVDIEGPTGKRPQTLKAAAASGKLSLSRSMTFSTPNGDMTQVTKETWELSDDGRTLTVNREQSSPRGSNTSTLVFTKS